MLILSVALKRGHALIASNTSVHMIGMDSRWVSSSRTAHHLHMKNQSRVGFCKTVQATTSMNGKKPHATSILKAHHSPSSPLQPQTMISATTIASNIAIVVCLGFLLSGGTLLVCWLSYGGKPWSGKGNGYGRQESAQGKVAVEMRMGTLRAEDCIVKNSSHVPLLAQMLSGRRRTLGRAQALWGGGRVLISVVLVDTRIVGRRLQV